MFRLKISSVGRIDHTPPPGNARTRVLLPSYPHIADKHVDLNLFINGRVFFSLNVWSRQKFIFSVHALLLCQV